MKATSPETFHLQELAWVIRFSQGAQVDLANREELQNLKLRLYEFVRRSMFYSGDLGHPEVFHPTFDQKRFVAYLTDGRLLQIQQDFKKALAAFADESLFSILLSKKASERVQFSWIAILPHYRFSHTVSISEDVTSQALLALGLHVEHAGLTGERIRRCARPECGTIFIRERAPQKGRAQYCSLACARMVAKAHYIARQRKKTDEDRDAEPDTAKKPTARVGRASASRKAKKK